MSDRFWKENAYEPGEPDRVVLCVSLKAERAGAPVWHRTWAMDAWGDAQGTAMARLVSVPVSLAVEAVIRGEILAQHLHLVDHIAGQTTDLTATGVAKGAETGA